MFRALIAIATLFLIPVTAVLAETVPYGLVQTWYTYAAYSPNDSMPIPGPDESRTQTGFGIKRARVGILYKQDDFKGFFFYEAVINKFVDAWLRYDINEMFSVQGGRFRGVGLQAGGLTSPVKLDLVDYPVMAKGWAAMTHGPDTRTIGAQLDARFNETFKASALLHNGSGTGNGFLPSNTSSIVATSDTTVAYGYTKTGALPKLDLGVYAEPLEGLDIGFTYGIPNKYRPQWNGEFVAAMTAYGYYSWDRYRLKVDFARLDSKHSTWDDTSDDYTSQGYALTLATGLNEQFELVGRYDSFDPDTELDNDRLANVALGVNFSPNPEKPYDHRLQLNYIRRLNETEPGREIPDPNVIQMVWQVFIH